MRNQEKSFPPPPAVSIFTGEKFDEKLVRFDLCLWPKYPYAEITHGDSHFLIRVCIKVCTYMKNRRATSIDGRMHENRLIERDVERRKEERR